MRSYPCIGAFLALIFAFAPVRVAAFDVPPNDGYVTDETSVLTAEQEAELERLLSAYRAETSNEIAVLIVETLRGEPIADAAVEIARAWGVGTASHDNGILLLVAYADREVFIATGYGLEGAVPDIAAKGIVETDIVPAFRGGDYAEGIRAGIEALQKHIGGEYTAERYVGREEGGGVSGSLVIVAFLLLEWLMAVMARTRSWWLGGVFGMFAGIVLVLLFGWWLSVPILVPAGLLLDYLVSKNYRAHRGGHVSFWAGGGWGPGGRGGGFGGFSGGSFGGGGAGGRWEIAEV